METSFLFGSSAAVIPLIDRTFLPGIKSSGAGCYLGVGYRGGHKALFSELRFFMDYFPDKSKYVGNLKLQASDIPFAYNMGIVDLITVGEEIHEGWNYYKIMDEDDVDAYSVADRYTYFRLYNAEADGCDNIGEVDMIGVQLMESTADTVTCNT